MATVTTLPLSRQQTRRRPPVNAYFADVPLCTVLALLLLGYHPAAEDGGIYTAAIASRLQPWLFPAEHGFAIAHTAHGLFLPLMVALVRTLHLPLATVVLLTYILATGLTVASAQSVAQAIFPERAIQRGALLLFVAAMGLPIAGTSLYLVDPYLTARSLSTPLLLFSLAFFFQNRKTSGVLCAAAAVLFHPLMAGWAMLIFATLLTLRSRNAVRNTTLLAGTFAAVLVLVQWLGPVDSVALRVASLSRDYWFPAQWEPYEMLGLVAPPILLGLFARVRSFSTQGRLLARATAIATTVSGVIACLLIHARNHSLLLARLQPLRLLHFTYCIFLLLLGGWLASQRGKYLRHLRWVFLGGAAIGLAVMQKQLYGHSGYFELAEASPVNGYQQAFLWVRQNTPPNALFALDADYTRSPGEDAQLFRAVSMRSALPDAAKDGGVASVVPALAAEWAVAARAQQDLAKLTDRDRIQRVRPLGATWIVLPAESDTHLPCPYRNGTAQVCRLP